MKLPLIGRALVAITAAVTLAGAAPTAANADIGPSPTFSIQLDQASTLFGTVSCNDTTHCIASGSHGAYQYDGTSWTPISTFASATEELRSDACNADGSCIIGADGDSWVRPTLTGTWNRVLFPFPKGTYFTSNNLNSPFNDLACTSATWCMGVGQHMVTRGGLLRPMILVWDGTSWHNMAPPAVGTFGNTFYDGVSCWSPSGCMLTGVRVIDRAGHFGSFQARWNGSSWHLLVLPSQGGTVDYNFPTVSCTSAYNCVAVADYRKAAPLWGVESAVWNGTKWALVGMLHDANDFHSADADVTCVSTTFCLDVGTKVVGGAGQALAEVFNGHSWSYAPALSETGQDTSLWWAACPDASNCYAVGAYDNSAPKGLIELYH